MMMVVAVVNMKVIMLIIDDHIDQLMMIMVMITLMIILMISIMIILIISLMTVTLVLMSS